MFFLAIFWPGLLVNIGFLLMARDAWVRPKLRWLLIFPALWFGGYLCIATASQLQARKFHADIKASNRGKEIAFRQEMHDVLVDRDPTARSHDSALAEELVLSYGLRRAYEKTSSQEKSFYRGYILSGRPCPPQRGRRLRDGGYGTGRPQVIAQDMCLILTDTRPDLPIVKVRIEPPTQQVGWAHTSTQTIKITSTDGDVTVVRAGRAVPYGWLPMFIAGCGLNSSRATWDCSAYFLREDTYAQDNELVPTALEDVVGPALGLRKASIRERYAGVEWR